jgi:hypothetical protein
LLLPLILSLDRKAAFGLFFEEEKKSDFPAFAGRQASVICFDLQSQVFI